VWISPKAAGQVSYYKRVVVVDERATAVDGCAAVATRPRGRYFWDVLTSPSCTENVESYPDYPHVVHKRWTNGKSGIHVTTGTKGVSCPQLSTSDPQGSRLVTWVGAVV